jgi:Domain of unknown function (DUF4333)
MRLPARTSAILALAAAAALVAGCGETVIDTSNIEAQAKTELERSLPARLGDGEAGKDLQRSLGIKVGEPIASVECPTDFEVEPKATFDCTVEFENGREATQTFRIENEKADVTVVSLKPAGEAQ